MRQILLILAAFISFYVEGQIAPLEVPSIHNRDFNRPQLDTSLKVLYETKTESAPAYYLNGKLVNSSLFLTINPKIITEIKVEKNDVEIDSIKYQGQLFVTTKSNYQYKFISLTDIELKYAKLKDAPTLFMIDNKLINEDYDKSILDENFLLRINVETIDNPKENMRLNLIRILTKTQENIKKVNEIMIRGESPSTNE